MRDKRIPDFRFYSILLWPDIVEGGIMKQNVKIMKNLILGCLALAVVSCGLEEVSMRPQGGAGDVWLKPGTNDGSDDPSKTVTYITAFDYPEGYDWRADREKGSVKCSLVVFADGIPMMKVPVGDSYEISSDPDMHRMVRGHLYTDYYTDSETVIKKDGKEILRYEGREMICGLAVKGDDIYTLGHFRSGDGFAYRKNGEILLERAQGSTFGRLCHNRDGSISFAFRESVKAVGDTLERYYYALNGEVFQTAVREDVKKVWDIVFCNGGICYLASVVGISSPVLLRSGEDMSALNMPEESKMLTCRIIQEDESLYVEGLCKREGKPLTSGLWHKNGNVYLFSDGMTVSSVCMSGDGICCVLNSSSTQKRGVIYRCGETYPMPQHYTSVGSAPSMVIDGILHVGLSSLIGTQPLIWKDGQTTALKINGYISTISTNK